MTGNLNCQWYLHRGWYLQGFYCTHVNCTSRAQPTADQVSRMDTFRAAVKGNVDIKKQQMVKIVEVSH